MYIKTIILFSILVSIVTLQAQSADTNLQLIMQGLRDDAVEISDGLLIDDFNMVANHEIEFRWSTPASHFHIIVFGSAGWHLLIRQVGYAQQ